MNINRINAKNDHKFIHIIFNINDLGNLFPQMIVNGILFALLSCVTVAIPIWEGRISPVLDVACRFLLIDYANGQETGRRELLIADHLPQLMAQGIKEACVDILICGAVSQPLGILIRKTGVQLIPYICGNINEVLQAFFSNQLHQPEFIMPGCWLEKSSQGCCAGNRISSRQHRHRMRARRHIIPS